MQNGVQSRREKKIDFFTRESSKYLSLLGAIGCDREWCDVIPKRKGNPNSAIIPRNSRHYNFSLALYCLLLLYLAILLFFRYLFFTQRDFSFSFSFRFISFALIWSIDPHALTLTWMMHHKEQIEWEENWWILGHRIPLTFFSTFLFARLSIRWFEISISRNLSTMRTQHRLEKSVFGSRRVSSRNPQSKFKIFLLANEFFLSFFFHCIYCYWCFILFFAVDVVVVASTLCVYFIRCFSSAILEPPHGIFLSTETCVRVGHSWRANFFITSTHTRI